MHPDIQHLVVMGVSGCGKSTAGEGLAQRLGWLYADGDRFHPQINLDLMAAGTPLTDEHRWGWLQALASWLTEQEVAGRSTVLACSSLRRAYRDVLRTGGSRVRFVHLDGSAEVLRQRLSRRAGHFFPPALLDSQLATLEPLAPDEDGVVVDFALGPTEQVDAALRQLGLGA